MINDHILQQIGHEPGEYHIYGPPGTGKTTTVSRIIEIAQERFGGDQVLVTSFSKAAAKELITRDLPIHPDHVGTLHSHCFQALGCPKIVDTMPELIAEWNLEQPKLEIQTDRRHKRGRKDEDDTGEEEDFQIDNQGEGWFPLLNRLRGQMVPVALWTNEQREAFQLWEAFKKRHQVVDFSDLIELAWRHFKIAPGNPRALFVDESQDLNPMQLALVRQWGAACDYFVLAFDDDQAIFVFTGVDPASLLSSELTESHKLVLDQSYRLPRAVHGYADGWIHQLGDRRQEKRYRPRAAEGLVRSLGGLGEGAREIILDTIQSELASGRKVMLLATCAYLLRPLTRQLRERAIPFFNPYRLSHNGWNPLHLERPAGPAARLRALIGPASEHRRWKAHEFALWVEPILVRGNFEAGGKDRVALLAPEHEIGFKDLDVTFTDETVESLLTANEAVYDRNDTGPLAHWWHRRLGGRDQDRYHMAVAVGAARGARALSEPPRVIVGTIHSVKGGEADSVILLPDVSTAIDRPEDVLYGYYPDEIIRQFYVGMTRAKERLYLAGPTTRLAVQWPRV
jgi:superfamily I DNA/RNA helicase